MSEASSSPDHASLPRLGSYQILRPLGSGGMSNVFQAIHEDSGSIVALKVLPRKLAQNSVLLQRFLREARSAENLDHPQIVAIYDRGFDQGRHYLVLEYVEGRDLFDRVRLDGTMAPDVAVRFIREVAEGLGYAAGLGMIHRDVKPANLLLTPDNHAKIIDLGLAFQADEEDERVTRDGTTVGTVDYMSPEQARDSRKLNERSDIYSLGCTFYYLLAGSPPFPGGTLADKLARHHAAEIPDVRDKNPDVPQDLARLIMKMMAKKPEHRFANYADLIRGLDQVGTPAGSVALGDLPDVLIDDDDDDDVVELTIATPSIQPPLRTLPAPPVDVPPVISLADLAALDADLPSASSQRRGISNPPTPPSPRSSAVLEAILDPDDDDDEEFVASGYRRSRDEIPLQTWIAAGVGVGLVIAILVFGVSFALSMLKPTPQSSIAGDEPEPLEEEGFSGSAANTAIPPRVPVAPVLKGRGSTAPGLPPSALPTIPDPIREGSPSPNQVEVSFAPEIQARLGSPPPHDSAGLDQKNRIVVRRIVDDDPIPQVTTLAGALGLPTDLVEIADLGPWHEDNFQVAGKSRLIRGRGGIRPILQVQLTWQALIRDQPAKFVLGGTNGIENLVFEGIDLVVDVRDLPLTQSTLFLCQGLNLTFRDCTITVANAEDRRTGFAVFRLADGPRPNQIRLERSLIRGPIQTLVEHEANRAQVVFDRTVIVGATGPLVAFNDRDQANCSIFLERSLLISRGSIFAWAKPPTATSIHVLGTTFAHLDPAAHAPWMTMRNLAEGNLKQGLDYAGSGNQWIGWAGAIQESGGLGSSGSIRQEIRAIWPESDSASGESATSWPPSMVPESVTARSLASLVPSLGPTLAQVARPDPYLLDETVYLFARLPAPVALNDLTSSAQADGSRPIVALGFDADATPESDFGVLLRDKVTDPTKRYVVRVTGTGIHAMTPVRLPDETSLVITGPVGTTSTQAVPVFYPSRPGLALIEVVRGDLAMAHLGFSNEGSTRTEHWLRVEDGLLALKRCRYRDTPTTAEPSSAAIVLTARSRGPLPPRVGSFQNPSDRLLADLQDCWINTTGAAIQAEVRRGVVRLENCLILAGEAAFRLNPVFDSASGLEADLILENCTVLAERLGVAVASAPGSGEFAGRPWLIWTRASAFPKSWREGGALLGVDPAAFSRGAVFWQSSNDIYEVSRFVTPLGTDSASVGSADLKRHWMDLWGINHTRGDRGPDARKSDRVMTFRDKDRPRYTRPGLSQLELDPKAHKDLGVDFRALPPIPRN